MSNPVLAASSTKKLGTAITLPDNYRLAPVTIKASNDTAEVFGNGKLLATLKKGDTAIFRVIFPKWWQFWRIPQWASTSLTGD